MKTIISTCVSPPTLADNGQRHDDDATAADIAVVLASSAVLFGLRLRKKKPY